MDDDPIATQWRIEWSDWHRVHGLLALLLLVAIGATLLTRWQASVVTYMLDTQCVETK